MKHLAFILVLLFLCGLCAGCASPEEDCDIAATTLPVYQFTALLCQGTDLTVTRLVTESVSCLHEYSLNVRQVRAVEQAKLVVINGAGLEEFMAEVLDGKETIDASAGIDLLESCHDHDHGHGDHHHEEDSHIWLSPANAILMAENICSGLCEAYPSLEYLFRENLLALQYRLQQLLQYGQETLSALSCREMITFHDGFSYFAHCFDLTILSAVEEESGSEASAKELIELIQMVQAHSLPAVFVESNGADAAAKIISNATGAGLFSLDMAMAGDDYFTAMYHNINTIREAMG